MYRSAATLPLLLAACSVNPAGQLPTEAATSDEQGAPVLLTAAGALAS